MKKEIIYIVVPIIICVSGIVFQSMFLSDTVVDTQQILNISNDLSAKFYKDSLVQSNVENVRKIFESNKRDDRSYGEVIADLLKAVENMLLKCGIEYKGNDINQDLDEVKDPKSGTTSFYINLSLTTDYKKIRNLLQLIEQNELVINIVALELYRSKLEKEDKNQGGVALKDSETDEYNTYVPITMKARLEFVKFYN
jgi:hypothetical protein